jgi:hypothetical protein
VQINNLGKVMKCLPGGLVKPKGKDGKYGKDHMYLKTELAKIHLNHLILQITDVLLSHSLRAFCQNKINYIK